MARSNKGQMARPYFGKAEESQRARKLKSKKAKKQKKLKS